MKTVQLSSRLADRPTVTERSPAGVLMGEIAERLLELAEVKGEANTLLWIMRINRLAQDPAGKRVIWHYLRFCTGDLSALTESHADVGERTRFRSKQAEHKEHRSALAVVAFHFPEVARVLNELKP